MLMPRHRARELGQETVHILKVGQYETVAGKVVKISELVRNSVEGTRSYPPQHPLSPATKRGSEPTRIDVRNETTLAAARRLVDEDLRVVALNFASAMNPGGGFLTGARAQEESLVRSSGLFACLVDNPMYDFHRTQGDAMYTSYAIYSPDVPVFRTDDGELLDEPWLCSFITAAAPNVRDMFHRSPDVMGEIRRAFKERIHKVLTIAAIHDHPAIVLGAWGCGAFGNDCADVAPLFAEALGGVFQGAFSRVIFAITDWSEEGRFIGPFQNVLRRG
jgi:uncharacterized protein (TIGR02452 family)